MKYSQDVTWPMAHLTSQYHPNILGPGLPYQASNDTAHTPNTLDHGHHNQTSKCLPRREEPCTCWRRQSGSLGATSGGYEGYRGYRGTLLEYTNIRSVQPTKVTLSCDWIKKASVHKGKSQISENAILVALFMMVVKNTGTHLWGESIVKKENLQNLASACCAP